MTSLSLNARHLSFIDKLLGLHGSSKDFGTRSKLLAPLPSREESHDMVMEMLSTDPSAHMSNFADQWMALNHDRS